MRIHDASEVDPVVGLSLRQARAAVDEACHDMERFHGMEPGEIMRTASRHLARMNTVRIRSTRVERSKSAWKDFRIRELEPLVEELKQQFQISSRLLAAR